MSPTLRSNLIRGLNIGLVAGVVLLYLCLVGLVEAFKDRNVVTGSITLGQVMLLVVPLIAGYRAALPRRTDPQAADVSGSLTRAALVGAISGAMLGLMRALNPMDRNDGEVAAWCAWRAQDGLTAAVADS